ncbi:hypothetical protein CJF32_00005362 [Rutstroemia sp. NJR-2017a WRK4]|nr:hypothetical protein CJF32_00005362 [Rutstroemia sp. NJR-2017a WRK4]
MTISLGKRLKKYTKKSQSGSNTPLANDGQISSIEMQELDSHDHEPDIKPSLRSLFSFATKNHTFDLVCCIVSGILSGALKPISAIFYGNIFGALTNYGAGVLTGSETLHKVSIWCIAITALGVATWLSEGIFLCSWMVFGELQAKSVREKMFTGLLNKDIQWYDLRKDGIGSLLIRIETQIRELQLSVSQPLGFLLFETVSAITALGTALYFSWNLTLVIIATFPLAGGILYLISRKLTPAIEAQKRELTEASKLANTAVTAIETVKAFNGQNQEVWQYLSAIKRSTAYYMVQARASALQFGITKFIMVAIFVQGFWYGISLVDHGLSAGRVLTTFYACMMGMQALEIILPQWLVLAKGMSAGETLKSIMDQVDRGKNVSQVEGSIKPASCDGDIEVNDVTFAYPSNPHQNVLSQTTFFFPAGETTFVVGKSGSGKSTLGNLLLKFYDPDEGSILIDGHPIKDLDTDWLRKNITLVLQQSVVFNETIRKNVEFGKEGETSDRDIINACQESSLDDVVVGLPKGLDTVVGSRERQLSGGQKQRVALARARLRDAPILILDEGTSALDHTCGATVMNNIRKWRKGKTTIIITHDISQILDDDYVYVMDKTRVVQEGYRNKLSAKENGTFATFTPEPKVLHKFDVHQGTTNRKRRKSEPITPTSSTFDTFDIDHRFSAAPTLFENPILPALRHRQSLDFSSTRMSRSSYYPIAFANDLRAKEIWGTPTESPRPRPRFNQFEKPHSKPRGHRARKHSPTRYSSPPQRYPEEKLFRVENVISDNYEIIPESSTQKIQEGKRLTAIRTDFPIAECSAIDPDIEKEGNSKRDENSSSNEPDKIEPASLKHILSTVWPILDKKERVVILSGFFAAFIVAAATPAFSIIFARLLDTFYNSTNRSAEAQKWSLALLGVAIIDGSACFCSHYALEHAGQAWVNALRVEALKQILAQPKSWFEESRNSPGRLNEVLDRNAEEMRNIIGRFAGIVFTASIMLFISVIWAFVNSWKLTLVLVACTPVIVCVTRLYHGVSGKWEHRCNYATEITTSIFSETFSNIKVVRAFTLENYFKEKHSNAAVDTFQVGRSRARYSGLLFGLSDGLTFFITATIFYYATVLVTQKSLSLSTALQTINLLLFGIANSTNMLTMIPQINSSRTTATHMLHLANLSPSKSHENLGSHRLTTLFPIRLRNLSFTYPARSETPTLKSITLSFHPNTTTALVGSSGCGKSTLTALLIGLYPPDPTPKDALTFAGVPIQKCHIPSLRSHISLVPQQPLLFPTTIRQNILYGIPESSSMRSQSSVTAAAKAASIHEFIISLPSGYETLIGEGGQGISPGQAQRIVIARALVRKPKLLILDEATSGLDGSSAETIRETVGRLRRVEGMATVVVSHTVEMMRMAGSVVVMDKGEVVEVGGFEELKGRRGGRFRELIGEGEGEGTGIQSVESDLADVDLDFGSSDEGMIDSPIRERRARGTWIRKRSF